MVYAKPGCIGWMKFHPCFREKVSNQDIRVMEPPCQCSGTLPVVRIVDILHPGVLPRGCMLVDETFRAHVETGETGKEYRDGTIRYRGLQPYLFQSGHIYPPVLWDKTSPFQPALRMDPEVPSG